MFGDFGGNQLRAGGGLGLQIRGEKFHVMPTVDSSRTMASYDAPLASADYDLIRCGITFGWVNGKEIKAIRQVDTKVDAMTEKLDEIGEKVDRIEEIEETVDETDPDPQDTETREGR